MITAASETVSPRAPQSVWCQRRGALGAAALAILGLVALTALPAESQMTVGSGNNQSGSTNSQVANPLVVQINCSTLGLVVPSPCGQVSWTSSAPGDSFSQPRCS